MADYELSSPDDDPSEAFEVLWLVKCEINHSDLPLLTRRMLQERLSELKVKWKAALKRNKKLLLKCPNYDVSSLQYLHELSY